MVDDEVSPVACQDAIDHLPVRTCILVYCRELGRGKFMHIYTHKQVSMHIYTDTYMRAQTHTQTNACTRTHTPYTKPMIILNK